MSTAAMPGMQAPRAALNWQAIDEDPRFQTLHSKKVGFLTGLMVFSLIYYFLLPIGAAYFTDLFKIKVYGVVNVGILFALSQFIVAWRQVAKFESTRSIRLPLSNDGAANVQGHVHKRAARLVE